MSYNCFILKLHEGGYQVDNLAYKNEQWVELLNGKEIAMSPHAINHVIVADNIFRIFSSYLHGKPCRAFTELEVHLTEKDVLIPDVMILCNKNLMSHKGIMGAPDLVVEVLSQSTAKRDKGYKKDIYEKHGVKEYWLVDYRNYSIEVYLLREGKFELDEVYSIVSDEVKEAMSDDEKLGIITEFAPSLFPDMSIVIEEVFQDLFYSN
jgi:Uma2 family endonuclease